MMITRGLVAGVILEVLVKGNVVSLSNTNSQTVLCVWKCVKRVDCVLNVLIKKKSGEEETSTGDASVQGVIYDDGVTGGSILTSKLTKMYTLNAYSSFVCQSHLNIINAYKQTFKRTKTKRKKPIRKRRILLRADCSSDG